LSDKFGFKKHSYHSIFPGIVFRLKGDDFDPNKPPNPDGIRIVISAPDKNISLMKSDIAFMLVQYEGERDP
jgi:hypothetical protein